jgi:hypothetical protein
MGRQPGTIANVQNDQAADRARISSTEPEANSAQVVAAVLRVRLCSQKLGPRDQSFWRTPSPAAWLVIDLIQGGGGIAQPSEDEMLSAEFADLWSALLTSRRIQWALEGFVQVPGSNQVSATVLVHGAGEILPPDGTARFSLRDADPGRIFVSEGLYHSISDLPGLAFGEHTVEGWHEVAWPRSVGSAILREEPASLPASTQTNQSLTKAAHHPPEPKPEVLESPDVASPPISPRSEGRSWLQAEENRWLILAGSAIFLLVVVGFIVIFSMTRPQPKAKGLQPIASQSGDTKPTAPSTPAPPQPSDQSSPERKTKLEARQNPETSPKTPVGACEFSEAAIERQLKRADDDLHDGELDEAKTLYTEIMPCPSARDQAREGLKRIKMREDLTGESPQ